MENDGRNSTRTWFFHLEHSKFCKKNEKKKTKKKQTVLENIILLDLANKLYDTDKFLISFYAICY